MKRNLKKKTSKLPKILNKLIIMFIISFLLFLFTLNMISYINDKSIKFDIIKNGEIFDSVNVDAIIIRDEYPLSSSKDGIAFFEIGDNHRVQAFSEVAVIIDEKFHNDFNKKINLDSQIDRIENKKVKNTKIFSADILNIEEEIENKNDKIVFETSNADFSNLAEYTQDIRNLVEKKADIILGISDVEKDQFGQVVKKNNLLGTMDQNTEKVYSKEAGIVSYSIDGYESLLNLERVLSYSKQKFDALKNVSINRESTNLKVSKNRYFAKIVRSNEYQLVFYHNKELNSYIKIGKEIRVRTNKYRIYPAVIRTIKEKSKTEKIVVLDLDKGVHELITNRRLKIDIIKKTIYGLKVPLIAIGKLDLIKKKGEIISIEKGLIKRKAVKINSNDDEYAIIEAMDKKNLIKLHDRYILKYDNRFKDGRFIF